MGNSQSLVQNPIEMIKQNQFDIILDVRTLEERNEGNYSRSVHIPLDQLERIFPSRYPDKNTRVLVYCRSGNRASQAVQKLNNLGYNQVFYTTLSYKELNQ